LTGTRLRSVIDTNIFFSATIAPRSAAGLAVRQAFARGEVLTSTEAFAELTEVLLRPKFNRNRAREARQHLLALCADSLVLVPVLSSVSDCRDPKDSMILKLALSGGADFIVTGDDNLLALDPWRDIRILTPAAFLAR